MRWIAAPSRDTATATLEKRLWEAADQLRANSGLTAAQYSQPVLGLIFLRFADARFAARRAELSKSASGRRGSRVDEPAAKSLTLDWQKTAQARARVKEAIEQTLDDGLPRAYTPEVFKTKAGVVFQHVYERYGRAA